MVGDGLLHAPHPERHIIVLRSSFDRVGGEGGG
jgi:hypothetical protein